MKSSLSAASSLLYSRRLWRLRSPASQDGARSANQGDKQHNRGYRHNADNSNTCISQAAAVVRGAARTAARSGRLTVRVSIVRTRSVRLRKRCGILKCWYRHCIVFFTLMIS